MKGAAYHYSFGAACVLPRGFLSKHVYVVRLIFMGLDIVHMSLGFVHPVSSRKSAPIAGSGSAGDSTGSRKYSLACGGLSIRGLFSKGSKTCGNQVRTWKASGLQLQLMVYKE